MSVTTYQLKTKASFTESTRVYTLTKVVQLLQPTRCTSLSWVNTRIIESSSTTVRKLWEVRMQRVTESRLANQMNHRWPQSFHNNHAVSWFTTLLRMIYKIWITAPRHVYLNYSLHRPHHYYLFYLGFRATINEKTRSYYHG